MRGAVPVAAAVGLALALGAPFLLGGGAALAGLRFVSPQLILSLAALAALSGVAKAGKLQALLISLGQRPPFLRTLGISLAADFAFLSSPAGAAGYVVNAALLRDAGSSWAVATAVVGADQALDLVFFAVAVPVAACSALGPLAQVLPKLPGSAYGALLCAGLVAVCALWYRRRRLAVAFYGLLRVLPWFRKKQEGLREFLSEVQAQLGMLVHGDALRNLVLLLLTSLQWLTRYGVLWLALLGLGWRLPFGFVLVLQAGIVHLAQWTGIPAGGGSADMALALALASWVSAPAMAVVLMLWRFATLYLPLVIGALSLAALSGHRRVGRLA